MNQIVTRVIVVLTALLSVLQSSFAKEYTPDSSRFEPKQLIAPGALITAGALCVGIKPLVQARKWVNNEIGIHKCAPADDILQYVPLVGYLGLEYVGVPSRRPIVDRALKGATSVIIYAALTNGLKYSVREPRPNGRRNSFPSGHSGTAFLGAELLRQDYGPWAGLAGYTVATGVGVMRILNGRHWFNDVLAGAGIGILSARCGQWLLPLERRWLKLDRPGQALILAPSYSPQTQTATLTAAIII
ncbi:MAG: phosphatase PAP2 family protein [Bacteroides sp.]|nr:phosphatase PAP2 family protein [Bacteroides sp.]